MSLFLMCVFYWAQIFTLVKSFNWKQQKNKIKKRKAPKFPKMEKPKR